MTVCSGEEVFTEPGGGAMELVTLGFGKDGVIAGAAAGGAVEGAIVAAGAIRETGGGAGRAKRRVNGSRRRKGAGLEITGAITESG